MQVWNYNSFIATQRENRMHWQTDTQLEAGLGDWWTQELELHNDNTMQQNVAQANKALVARGLNAVLVDCRDAGDELEWLVAG
jgi:hypothetical protein